MHAFKILIVDDEADLRDVLKYRFEKAGYRVDVAASGVAALDLLDAVQPDLILLDVMMTGMDGFEVCKRIRSIEKWVNVPVIMLTAKNAEVDEVAGLDVGADDYVKKPVSIRLLLSRVNALLRRSTTTEDNGVLKADDIHVDTQQYRVIRSRENGKSEEIHFPRKEFELLAFLLAHQGQVFSRQELLNQVWGEDVHVVDRTVDVHIRKIREKLGSEHIQTVKGIGYRFRSGTES